MRNAQYFIIGILLTAAILIIYASNRSEKDPLEANLIQTTPATQITQIPNESLGSEITQEEVFGSEILGEETQEETTIISSAIISTTKGNIVIEFFPEAATNTVTNFVQKSLNKFYDGLTFHRVEDWVVQGGDPLGNGTGGGQMLTELNNNPFIRGSVGVARGGDVRISNDAQFFITKTDAPWLDRQYTNFGQVTQGMEVVDSIEIGDKIISIAFE